MGAPPVERRVPTRVRVVAVLGLALLPAVWFLEGHGKSGQSDGPFLICPVASGVVKDNFGAPRAGHTHYGDDIETALGQPVLATFDGTIHDSQTAGGKIVKLEAPDGSFTVGKHLSATTPERPVQTGDVIGYVGKLDALRALPHLHFEWHPGGGAAVDPFPYLSEVCPDTRIPPRTARSPS